MGILFGKTKQESAPDERLAELQSEYQNYRRRTKQELEDAELAARKKVVQEFLPLYDDFQRALAVPCQDEAFLKGIRMMQNNLMSILESLGVRPMDSVGKCFNPDYHEAVGHITDENRREEEIVEVLRVGFTMDEEVIRHASVIVAN